LRYCSLPGAHKQTAYAASAFEHRTIPHPQAVND